MNASVFKFAPTAVVVVASGVCVWPYFGSMHSPEPVAPPPADASKEIPAALLKPVPPPRPERDPFQDPEQLRAAARERIGKALKDYLGARFVPKKAGDRAPAGRATGHGQSKAGEPDPREGLVLSATSVQGARGVAVINGRSFATGDRVKLTRGEPVMLAEVGMRAVVLLHRGRRLPLGYRAPDATRVARPADGSKEPAAVTAGEDGLVATPAPAPARRSPGRKRAAARN